MVIAFRRARNMSKHGFFLVMNTGWEDLGMFNLRII
jgi:hypothetical protein